MYTKILETRKWCGFTFKLVEVEYANDKIGWQIHRRGDTPNDSGLTFFRSKSEALDAWELVGSVRI